MVKSTIFESNQTLHALNEEKNLTLTSVQKLCHEVTSPRPRLSIDKALRVKVDLNGKGIFELPAI